MLIVLYLVLMLTFGRCTGKLKFETVRVGEPVTMSCDRRSTGAIFWIRIISRTIPEFLGKTYAYKTDSRITTKEEHESFVLRIKNTQLSDTAVYYCMKTYQGTLEFLEAKDLRVKGPTSHTTAAPTNDLVPPKDPVSVPCSVLSDTEDKMCPEEKCVCCLRAGPHQSPLCFNYTHGCSIYEEDKNLSTEKCLCSFLRNFTDAWTHRCAENAHGEILPGNRSKLNNEENCLQKNNTVISLLCAALAVSLVIIVCLVVSIKNLKKKTQAAILLQTNAAASGFQENQQTDEDSLIYSAPAFIRNVAKAEMRDAKSAENESIYSTVVCHNQNTTGSSAGN